MDLPGTPLICPTEKSNFCQKNFSENLRFYQEMEFFGLSQEGVLGPFYPTLLWLAPT